jgi:hypothetical protein
MLEETARAFAVALILALLHAQAHAMSPIQQPHPNEAQAETAQSDPDQIGWADASMAAFTFFVAVFTGALALTSKRQVNLSREVFAATHRPRILILSVEHAHVASGDKSSFDDLTISAGIRYVNAGESDAKITSVVGRLFYVHGTLRPGLPLPSLGLNPRTLASGEREHFVIFSEPNMTIGTARVFCVGEIVYEDGLGRSRATGFCRESVRKPGGPDRQWQPVEGSTEYDYAY